MTDLKGISASVKVRMRAALGVLSGQLLNWRLSTLNLETLKNLEVKVGGNCKVKLINVASITNLGSKVAMVRVHDEINCRAIGEGLTTSSFDVSNTKDRTFNVRIPQPTAERRIEIIRAVKSECEKVKVRIRSIRRDANNAVLKTCKELKCPRDEGHKLMKEIQELTDLNIRLIDDMLLKKQAEIEKKMTIDC